MGTNDKVLRVEHVGRRLNSILCSMNTNDNTGLLEQIYTSANEMSSSTKEFRLRLWNMVVYSTLYKKKFLRIKI